MNNVLPILKLTVLSTKARVKIWKRSLVLIQLRLTTTIMMIAGGKNLVIVIQKVRLIGATGRPGAIIVKDGRNAGLRSPSKANTTKASVKSWKRDSAKVTALKNVANGKRKVTAKKTTMVNIAITGPGATHAMDLKNAMPRLKLMAKNIQTIATS